MHRIDWDDGEDRGTEFNLTISEWMRLFDATGFDVVALHELQAPQPGSEVKFYVSADWAHDYPSEQVPAKMSDLPTGTVTFFFSDIEGSTKAPRRLGPDFREVLDRHVTVVRRALAENRGTELETEGDSSSAVHQLDPRRAVRRRGADRP